jgi:hypothetical protein
MIFKTTNWLAILVAFVVCSAIGFLWYGFLFLEPWMLANNITMDAATGKSFKNGVEMDGATPMIMNSVATILIILFMDWLIKKTGDTTLLKGLKLGFILGLVMYIGEAVTNMFSGTPYKLTMIDGFYAMVIWTVMGAIIGGWRKSVG